MCKYSIQFNISLRKSSKTYLAYTLFRETTKKTFHFLDLGHKILIKKKPIFLNFNFLSKYFSPSEIGSVQINLNNDW